MDILSFVGNYIVLFLLLISLLVFVHEFGHYSVARWVGVKAEIFSVGFGPEIAGWTSRRTGTRWRISLIPLGGYVKFLGEMMPGADARADAAIPPEIRKSAFHTQPVWKRAAIVAAGPLANLVFAWFLCAIALYAFGQAYTLPVVGVVEAGGPADRAGIKPGDTLLTFDGTPITRFEDFEQEVQIRPTAQVTIGLRRDGQELERQLTLEPYRLVDRFGNVHRLGKAGLYGPNELPVVGGTLPGSPAALAGIEPGDRILEINGTRIERFSKIPELLRTSAGQRTVVSIARSDRTMEIALVPQAAPLEKDAATQPPPSQGRIGITSGRYTDVRHFDVPQAAVGAVHSVVRECSAFYTLLRQLALGLRPLDELSGPMRMAKATGEVAQIGWTAVLGFAIVISVLLGLFNLLPVPLLDGGHLLYYAIEWIRGRPLGPRAQEYGFRFGFVLVMSATVLATWNDVTQIFGHLWR